MAITHEFVSAKNDGTDETLIKPSNWNAVHVVDGYVPFTGSDQNVDLGLFGITGGNPTHSFRFGISTENFAGYLANDDMYINFADSSTQLGIYMTDSVHDISILKSNVTPYAAKFAVAGDTEYTIFSDGTYAQNILGEITQNGAVTKINSGDYKFFGTDGTYNGAIVDQDVGASGHFWSGDYDVTLGQASACAVFQDGVTYTTFGDKVNAISTNGNITTSATGSFASIKLGSTSLSEAQLISLIGLL